MSAPEELPAQRAPIRASERRDTEAELRDERDASGLRSRSAHGPHSPAARLAELRALARSDPNAFDRRFEALVAGAVPATDQFTTLRVAYEEQRPASVERLAQAVATLSQASGAEAQSVPEALVHFLGVHGARESRARDTLAAIVWCGSHCAESALRVRALRELILSSPEEDLPQLTRRIGAEGDPVVHSAGLAVLDERAHPAPPLEPTEEFP